MKIQIISNEGYKLRLRLPTALLKSKIIRKTFSKYGNFGFVSFMDLSPLFYKNLKKYVKQHGHFNLVEIESSDGDKVIIEV